MELTNLQENEVVPRLTSCFYNTERSIDTSETYQVANTFEVVDYFRQNGFYISGYSEAGVRAEKNRGKTRHVVRLRRIGDEGKYLPEIVITNSHNKYSALKINIGIYRIACANGLMLGDTFFSERIIHTGREFNTNMLGLLQVIDEKFKESIAVINKMETTYLLPREQERFLLNVIPIRFKSKFDIIMTPDDIKRNLTPKRVEDMEPTLWNLLNIIQEKGIHGELKYHTVDISKQTTSETCKPLRSITYKENFNKAIFDLAIEAAYA